METPAFLALSAEEMSSWKDAPITKLYLEWLEWEEGRCREAIVDAVAGDHDAHARILVGALKTLRNVKSAVFIPAALPEVEEDDYIDPATRPSILKGKK